MGRSARSCAAVVLSVTALASPAPAYRVYLDHDTDGDLATLDNVVEGLDVAPITLAVILDPGDADLDLVTFAISWDCHQDGFFGVPHGDIEWPPAPVPSPPFIEPVQIACTGFGCGCVASRLFESPVGEPRDPGTYRFAILDFSRDAGYDAVRFELDCWECAYVPGDEERRTMTFCSPIPVGASSWGRTKAGYR